MRVRAATDGDVRGGFRAEFRNPTDESVNLQYDGLALLDSSRIQVGSVSFVAARLQPQLAPGEHSQAVTRTFSFGVIALTQANATEHLSFE